MKLKKIEAICKARRQLTIYNGKTADGEMSQWIGDGFGVYLVEGMPIVTPEEILRIFDVPTDKQDKWACHHDRLPESMDFSDPNENEEDLTPKSAKIIWNDTTYIMFKDGDGKEIYAINDAYLKPFAGNMDYVRFLRRTTKEGSFNLGISVGLCLQAIIAPILIDETITEEITEIAEAFLYMQKIQK